MNVGSLISLSNLLFKKKKKNLFVCFILRDVLIPFGSLCLAFPERIQLLKSKVIKKKKIVIFVVSWWRSVWWFV
jgi:hypothetical protein